uniref:Cmyb_C domain-containing protein n=1 Tax=Rhabditophanes sp. KR3021 TaxID=114890 RepID=A0AC35TYW2_9BILA
MNGSTTANSPPQNHPTPDNNKKVFITTIQNSNDTGCEKDGSRTDYVSNVVISSAANSQKNSIVNIQPPSTLSITDNTEHLPTLNSSNHILSNKIHTEIWEQQTIGRGVVPLINIQNDDDNSSDSDSFATSPILPMQRKLSLMPALTEEDLLNSDLGQKDPVFVAKVFGQDFATQLSSKNETSPRGDFVTSDVKKTLFSNEDNFLHLSLHSNSPLWPFAPRDETIPSGVPTLKIRVLQNNPQSPTTQAVTRKLGSFSHSTRPTLSPSSKESIRPNLSASNKESFDHTKVNREDPKKAIEAPYKEYSVLLAPDPLPRNILPTKFHFSLPPTHFGGNSSPSPFTHHPHLFPTSFNSTTHLKNKLTPEMLKFAHSLDYDDDKSNTHLNLITTKDQVVFV